MSLEDERLHEQGSVERSLGENDGVVNKVDATESSARMSRNDVNIDQVYLSKHEVLDLPAGQREVTIRNIGSCARKACRT